MSRGVYYKDLAPGSLHVFFRDLLQGSGFIVHLQRPRGLTITGVITRQDDEGGILMRTHHQWRWKGDRGDGRREQRGIQVCHEHKYHHKHVFKNPP